MKHATSTTVDKDKNIAKSLLQKDVVILVQLNIAAYCSLIVKGKMVCLDTNKFFF